MRVYLFVVMLMFTINAYSAVNIVSVTRDLDYPDIFTYKEKVIGEPRVNKFDFPGKFDSDTVQPEFFWVKIKSDKAEKNRKVKVVFTYKSKLSKTPETQIKNLTLTRSNRIRFWWSAEDCAKKGRVEVWEVKVLDGNEILAEKHSGAGSCARFN